MTKIKKLSAFSIIELSIAISIISLIIASTLIISKSSAVTSSINETNTKLIEINKALGNFLIANKRLPCPADITALKTDSDYGAEGISSGVCTTTSGHLAVSSKTAADTLLWGMIPTQALNLDNDMAQDGFKAKFSYIVGSEFTQSYATSSTDSFEGANPSDVDTITIEELSSGTTVEIKDVVFVIISHGLNGYGAFKILGSSQNTYSGLAVTDEEDNVYINNGTDAEDYDEDFVISSTDSDYDDILLYKTKTEIILDAGMEFMMCNGDEADYITSCTNTPTLTWSDTVYGITKNADVACADLNGCGNGGTLTKTCGKYGQWGSRSGDCSN